LSGAVSATMKFFQIFRHKPAVDFVSPLPLEECRARLFGISEYQHRLPLLTERPITRQLNDSDFYLARGMVVHLQGCRPAGLAESAVRPVLSCHLIVQSGNDVEIRGDFGFHSLKSILLLSLVAMWLISSLCLAVSLILGNVATTSTIGWAVIILSLVGPLMFASSYLHERTHLPYLSIYLRRVLLDPSLDPDLSQFTRAPYGHFARGLQIVLFLITGSVIGACFFLIFHRLQG
jgi:hypothetical protein